MIPPRGGPGRGERSGKGAGLGLAARVLAREAVIGTALCVGAATGRIDRVGMALAALGLAVVWTRFFGALQPRNWTGAIGEGPLLYGGSVCFGNLLLLTLRAAARWAGPG